MNAIYKIFILLLFIISLGCSSGIDPNLQEQIDYKSYSTEELYDHYEDLNEDLVEVIEEKNYYLKKLIKAKNEFRTLSTRRYNRQTRIDAIESPKVAEGQPIPQLDEGKLESHKERVVEYDEDIAEVQKEIDEYLALSKELTAKALQLRTNRNKAYDAYINSREELKALNKKADEQRKQ